MIKKNKFFILIGLLCLKVQLNPVFCQDSQLAANKAEYNLHYHHYASKDGLISNDVRKVICDSKGFIWVATGEGLDRFDGRNFKQFEGLRSNDIHWVIEDGQERLWVRIEKDNQYLIDLIDLNTFKVTPLESQIQLFDKNSIGYLDYQAGWIYVSATQDQKSTVFKVSGQLAPQLLYQTEKFTKNFLVQATPDGSIFLLQDVATNPHTLWIDKEGQLIKRFDGLHYYLRSNPAQEAYLLEMSGKDKDAPINILKNRQLEKTIPLSHLIKEKEHFSKLRLLHYDKEAKRYLKVNAKGVAVFDDNGTQIGKTNNKIYLDNPGITLHQPCFDKQGNIWLSTVQHGIIYIYIKKKVFHTISIHQKDSLLKEKTIDLTQPVPLIEDQVWLAKKNVYTYHSQNHSVSKWITQAPNKLLLATINQQNEPILLVKNEVDQSYSVFEIDKNKSAWNSNPITLNSAAPLSPKVMYEDRMGHIWIGTDRGIYRKKKSATAFQLFKHQAEDLENLKVHYFAEDQRGFWISTETAIYLYRPSNDSLEKIDISEESSIKIFPKPQYILPTKTGKYWVTSFGYGLGELDYEKKDFKIYSANNGLSTGITYLSIYDQNDRLWISSRNGIFRMDKTKENIASIQLGQGNFLDTYSDFVTSTPDGQIIFSSQRGLLSFHPENLPDSSNCPIYISSVSSLNASTGVYEDRMIDFLKEKKLVINPAQPNLKLNFALLDYIAPIQHQYQYKIIGLHDEWHPLKTNTLLLSGLDYGSFELKIRAQNELGQIAKTQISFPLIVSKPYYLQWWFVLAAILISFLSINWLILWRTKNLKKRQEELEKLISEATATIQQQNKELRNINEVKSRFFANISHELRTPITLILGPLNKVLKNNYFKYEEMSLLRMMETNGKNLLKLVNEILDLTKLEAGALNLNEKAIVFYPFLSRLVAVFSSLAQRQKINLIFEYKANADLQLSLDADKFEKIFNNLLINALKFTPENGVVKVVFSDQKSHLQLFISDTGRGIHPEDLPHIFNRFYQSSNKNTIEGGTGIGLSLVNEFAKLFEGSIEVKSELGTGSTFYFNFPKKEIIKSLADKELLSIQKLQTTTDITPSITLKNNVSNKNPLSKSKRANILCVEDNRDLQDYLQFILKEKYQIISANNGQIALEYLVSCTAPSNKEQPIPDLIISDVMMPLMDGFQLLHFLKSNEKYRAIPFIMLTARADINDKLKALRIGVDDYIKKPFIEAELLLRVENLLKNSENRKLFQPVPIQKTEPLSVSNSDQKWLEDQETWLRQTLKNPHLTVRFWAHQLPMSERQFQRKIKKLSGLTPQQYLQEIRLDQAHKLLASNTYPSISKIAEEVGFKNLQTFKNNFRKKYGKLPSL
jgi:signal transduction histidine kinase/DNA-binding response OmpR family regulator/ligand-binding sensor domain-containing protein